MLHSKSVRQLDHAMGSTRFRNPRALNSALAVLGTLQPRALGFLNRVDPLVSVSNLYLDTETKGSTREQKLCQQARYKA